VFSKCLNLSNINIPVPTVAEVCVLEHIWDVMLVPHDAQESLSSDRTPTLSYLLPFYHSIVDEWERLKSIYLLLSPFIQLAINKVKSYIDKSNLSQTYLLTICKLPHFLEVSILM
jgi:hypothetical protein